MHKTTLRFPDDVWALVARESRRERVSVAQYIREAALARAYISITKRGGSELAEFEQALRHIQRAYGVPDDEPDP